MFGWGVVMDVVVIVCVFCSFVDWSVGGGGECVDYG